MFKPYSRRIQKYTRNNGEVFFKIEQPFMSGWAACTAIKFDSFGEAANHIRKFELRQIKESNTVSKF